ncbi:ABC transporter permease [Niveispirillum cyanobacteriorum]|uniref:ABC3 transporter permease C-terminal domain-containing protein n=1 Tax=Niveispirillum cyanobacteriorum TaxID=1612173 RepID=A0A2K9NJN2_9PROT|nr:ABC transporter permease [Niveispirillum cyanobacteriorum]AUN33289.1 hypothetical protein C0V82_23235 [Niveispirillum cyanobacteriorum]
MPMIFNWLVIAGRTLVRERSVAALNAAGLTLGFLTCIMIAAYLRAEIGFDRVWPQVDRIIRVGFDFPVTGQKSYSTQTSSALLAPMMQAELPGLDVVARLRPSRVVAKVDDRIFAEVLAFADPEAFSLFTLPVLAGDPVLALAEPNRLVLTVSTARRLLGTGELAPDAIVTIDGVPMQIGAIVGDWPRSSFLDLGMFASWSSAPNPALRDGERDNWFNLGTHSFARLNDGQSPSDIEPALADLLERHVPTGQRPDNVRNVAEFAKARVDRLSSIHLSETGNAGLGVRPPGSMIAVTAFAVTGLVVLVMAGLNFAMLTAALAGRRRKEAAVRRVLGGTSQNLLFQFLLEGILMSVAALILALAVAELIMPSLGAALGRDLSLSELMSPTGVAVMFVSSLVVGVIGGIVPATSLASTAPASALRSNGSGKAPGQRWSVLICLQFAIGIGLGIAAMVVQLQTHHLQTLAPGYNANGLVILSGLEKPVAKQAWTVLRQSLLSYPGILDVTSSSTVPGVTTQATTAIRPTQQPDVPAVDVKLMQVADRFVETYGVALLAGRSLEESRDANSDAVILNRSAVLALGLRHPQEALGVQVSTVAGHRATYVVVGIIEDMQMRPGREAANPAMLVLNSDAGNFVTVRVADNRVAEALASIDATWVRLVPDLPIRRSHLSDQLMLLHGSEAVQAKVLTIFAGLAIIVACLGLLGISGLAARRRSPEIALRKVLGATGNDILRLMLWDMLRPILLSAAIACPLSWLAMDWWLAGFASRITLEPALFMFAVTGAVILALLTALYYGARASLVRPAIMLRTD